MTPSDRNSKHSSERAHATPDAGDPTEGDASSFLAVATVLVVLGSVSVALFVAVGVLAWKAGTP
jgi:hypothetical protein